MADRRGTLVPLLILAWIFFSPSPQNVSRDNIHTRPRYEDTIAEEQRSLDVLNNSTWAETGIGGDDGGYQSLNLTGFEDDRGYAWDAWPLIKEGVVEEADWAQRALRGQPWGEAPALYENISGIVHGRWRRSEVEGKYTAPCLNLSAYTPENPFGPRRPREFGRNLTAAGGDVRVQFKQFGLAGEEFHLRDVGNVTKMSVDLNLGEDDTGEEHELVLRGLYFMDAGHAVLTTTSNKFAGIFALPHFTPTEYTFNVSRDVLNASISNTIRQQTAHEILSMNPWSTSAFASHERQSPPLGCELILWLQQLSPTSPSATTLSFLEHELRSPTGSLLPQIPDLHFSMTAFSPDCGYILTSTGPPNTSPALANHLHGPKTPVLATRGRHHTLLLIALLALQLALLRNQMRESSTPSTRSRISFYTIFMMALGDGYVCAVCSMLGALFEGVGVDLMAAAFLALVGMLFMGMQFLMQIWSVHAPELRQRERANVEEELNRRDEILAELRAARARREAEVSARGDGGARAGGENAPIATETPVQAPPRSAVDGPPPANRIAAPPPAANPTTTPSASPPTTQPPQPSTPIRPPETPPLNPSPSFYMPSDQSSLLPTTTFPPSPFPLAPLTPDQRAVLTEALLDSRIPSFGTHYARFAFTLLLTTFLSSSFLALPAGPKKVLFVALAWVYLGFWIPQIIRNARRNVRKALTWEFVAGESALRCLPFVYFFAYERNILFVARDLRILALLAGWQWVQVLTLGSQALLGPRWFVPRGWVEEGYDWHPVLRVDLEGAGLPPGSHPVGGKGDSKEGGKGRGCRVWDCAICLRGVEVPVVEGAGETSTGAGGAGGASSGGEGGGSGGLGKVGFALARRGYMVTPCRHVFHEECLEGWVKFRLVCPVCREGLPAV